MGTQVPRALISTLLIAGVFYAPFAPLAHADEPIIASSTEAIATSTTASILVATTTERIIELQTIEASATASTTEVATSSESPPTPLPTGVLLDNSYSDIPWSIQIYDGTGYPGHYTYFFTGYQSLGNPPVLSPENAWVTTGTTTTVRIKRISGPSCNDFVYLGTGGLGVMGPQYNSYETDARWTRAVGDYCDFQLYGEGIPPGTPLTALYLGTTPETMLAGSHANTGMSLNGIYDNPVSGGFAFQLCGIDGCSGGFGSSTPTATTTASTTPPGPQVSNVLFLPGIKGSRLYSDEIRCGVIGCDNKLWDPLGDSDVQDLYLDSFGKSTRNDIYTKSGDIIDKIDKKYYDSFIKEMDGLQASTTFDGGNFRWKPIAYDWRLSLNDLVANGVERDGKIYYEEASSTPYIEQTLKQLAATSTTGKVTIVAHSNGGLVVKALLTKLGPEETARLVDKIIFVGVPQTGAPQALGALLFGDHEGLPNDNLPLLVSRSAARSLAENSPMAYHLMPSDKYLHDTQDPTHSILSFSGSVLFPKELSAYGTSIDTINELDNFLLGTENGRVRPSPQDIDSANILNSWLISYANTTHTSLDAWTPPVNVSLYQIAGWGANTISGIDFYDEQKIVGVSIGHKRLYRLSFVEDGDGVVPIPSAMAISTSTSNIQRFWIDLKSISTRDKQKFDHGNIFETSSLLETLQNILNNQNSLPPYVTNTQPTPTETDKKLIFQLHSPLTLGLFDSNGNYTGLNKDGTVTEEIPEVEYGEMGGLKYIIAPANQAYSLVMNGLDEGRFSLDIQEQVNGHITSSATIADVPVTPNTIARLSIETDLNHVSDLAVDSNGDGVSEIKILPMPGKTVMYGEIIPTDSVTPSSRHSSLVTTPTLHFVTMAKNPSVPISPIMPSITITKGVVKTISPTATSTKFSHLTRDDSSSQMAAAYTAFNPLEKWFQLVMYNTWKLLMGMFRNILNI